MLANPLPPLPVAGQAIERWGLAAMAACLVAAWLNPVHQLPWTSFASEAPAAIAALLCALTALLCWQPRQAPIPKEAAALGMLGLIAWLQWAFGILPFAGDAWLVSLYLGLSALGVWAGGAAAYAGRSRALAAAVAAAILVAALISAAISMYQWLGLTDWGEWVVVGRLGERPIGNLAQSNHLASLQLMGLLAIGYLLPRRKLGAIAAQWSAVILCMGLALAQSRTTWVAIAALGLLLSCRQEGLWRPSGIRPRVAVSWLGLYALCWAAVQLAPHYLPMDKSVVESGRQGVGLRPLLWAQLVEAIQLNPWRGYGWLQGYSAQAAAALSVPGKEFASFSHNLLLDLVVWNGVPLGGLLGFFLLGWYLRFVRRATGVQGALAATTLTALLVHAMLEYPHAYLYFCVPVALLVGASQPAADNTHAPLPAQRWRGTTRATLCLMALLACSALGLAVLRDYMLAEQDRRDTLMVLQRIGGELPMPPQPKLWLLTQLAASGRAVRVRVQPSMSSVDVADLGAAAARYPSVHLLRAQAAALAMTGSADQAVLVLKTLQGLHGPMHVELALEWMVELGQQRNWHEQDFIAYARATLN